MLCNCLIQILELAGRPNVYDLLVKSLAPSIWELDDVKKGVLCMLFGGNLQHGGGGTGGRDSDSDEDGGDGPVVVGSKGRGDKQGKRGDINILLCGDPGTSKSQLLSYVHQISPRGVYTSGKGSSAVGE